MFQPGASDKTYAFNPSLLRSLAGCALTCPENSCLIDCKCKSGDDCPKDFTTILIVISAVIVGIIFVSVGCYLYRKEKKENRMAGLQVVQIPRVSRRELGDLNSSTVNLREDPLDLSIVNNARTDLHVAAQVGIPINIPGSVSSPIEDNSTMVIANNLPDDQNDTEPADCENDKPNDITVIKDMNQVNEEHSTSNIIIHKVPLNQQDNFEVTEDKEEENSSSEEPVIEEENKLD